MVTKEGRGRGRGGEGEATATLANWPIDFYVGVRWGRKREEEKEKNEEDE